MNPFFPQTLYRYRSCEEKHIEAFYKNQVWASNSECMNDGYDARMFFDRFAVEKEIGESLSNEALSSILASLKNGHSPFSAFVSQYDMKELYMRLTQCRDSIKLDISKSLVDMASIVQRASKFVCLSEDIRSAAMWGLYGNNESGFALAYDFKSWTWHNNLPSGIHETFNLYPMVYSSERFKVTNEYIQFLLKNSLLLNKFNPIFIQQMFPCPDKSMVAKIALRKSTEWSYENEWRIIFTRNDMESSISKAVFFELAPSALYLGRRISYINERLLTDIAQEKRIPIYKMSLNDESPTFDLIPQEVK